MSELDRDIELKIATIRGDVSGLSEAECELLRAAFAREMLDAERRVAFYVRAMEIVNARSAEITRRHNELREKVLKFGARAQS